MQQLKRAKSWVRDFRYSKYSKRVMLLLFLILALDYADRTYLGALGPTLKQQFNLNNTKFGLIAAAFAIVSAGAVIPFGMLIDRANRMRLLAASLAIWTGGVAISGAAFSAAVLVAGRLLLGASSAATGPATPSVVGDLMAPSDRGRALGFIDSGELVGMGTGYLLGALAAALLSFRWGFWLLAVAGALLVLAFWTTAEPARSRDAGLPGDGQQEQQTRNLRAMLRRSNVEPSTSALLRRRPSEMSLWDAGMYVLRVRTDVIVILTRAIGDYFLAGVGTFAVVFATGQYHVSEHIADLAILVLGLGALAGIAGASWLSDSLVHRGHLNSRVWLGAIGYALAPFVLLPALFTHTLAVALPFIAVGACLLGGSGPPLDAVRVDVLVPALRGRGEAVRQVLRTIAEGIAPAVFGVVSSLLAGGGSEGLRLTFLVTLPLLLVSGLGTLIALRTYEPDVAAALASTAQDQAAA